MGGKEIREERSQNKRYRAVEGAFAVINFSSHKLGQIIDVRMGGGCFKYVDTGIVTGFIILQITIMLMLNINLCSALPSTRLISVKFSQTSKVESIELLINRPPDYVTFNLKNPNRFVLDLKKCYFPKVRDVIETDSKYIKKIRTSQFEHDRVRLAIDQKIDIPVLVEKKELFHGTVLILSIQLPEITVDEKTIQPLVIFTPSQKSEMSEFQEPTDTKIEPEATAGKQDETLPGTPDEDLNSIFNVAEQGSDTTPEVMLTDDPAGSIDAEPAKFSIDGDFRNETAYRLDTPHHFSKIKNILNLEASGVLSDNLSYVLGGRFSYDAVFDLTDDYNSAVEDDQRLMADLRDAYFDAGLGSFDLRLGNQQIVWGQAVGLFFADIVNPKDLREYILPELDQIRIPVFAANLEYYYDSYYFQMIFIPFPEFNEFGKPGSEFDFSKQLYYPNTDIVYYDPEEPTNSLDNSEVGVRVSKLTGGWDMSLFYFYDYYNFPVNYRSVSFNPPGSQNPVTVTYLPEYERMHRVGSTFSKEIMDAILKGEFIYSNKMFYQTSGAADADGIEKSDSFDWLLGIDYTFAHSLETNFQLMQNVILDYESSMTQRQYSTAFSIWMRKGFFEDLLEPELFFVSSLNDWDFLLRPRITYNYNDSLKFGLGVDIFYGEMDGAFGMFDENDRMFIEMIYNF